MDTFNLISVSRIEYGVGAVFLGGFLYLLLTVGIVLILSLFEPSKLNVMSDLKNING